ncbi:CDP-diacylglycerol--inositol 3-phosphatidyltransferase [Porphyridium purpureum]|uniref:CDP-diacylglycerol--inositol 3-phosphatidyltransferase n=1 Tax=Porphyridium purpureum TaxID=35688 RepID=A0A5J4YZA3_PORPP|nr:CDP-diacylglycerol--inositol 3-phosphatidyltransferase [Porphyridium purpureum]|eukprot:POR0101..scf209_3
MDRGETSSAAPTAAGGGGGKWRALGYVPNVIGYVRIFLGALAFVDWRNAQRFCVLYALSFVLDAADGYAARRFNQASELGSYLDMITDRVATMALLAVTAVSAGELHDAISGSAVSVLGLRQQHTHFLQQRLITLLLDRDCAFALQTALLLLVALDGVSHWNQMLAGLTNEVGSHKQANRNRLLQFYYWRPVLTVVCIFNELFLLMLFVLLQQSSGKTYAPGASLWQTWEFPLTMVTVLLVISFPFFVLKQGVSVQQIASSHFTILRGASRQSRARDREVQKNVSR